MQVIRMAPSSISARASLTKTHLWDARPFALTGTTVHNITGALDRLLAARATLHKQQVILRLLSRDKVDQIETVFLRKIARLRKTQAVPSSITPCLTRSL